MQSLRTGRGLAEANAGNYAAAPPSCYLTSRPPVSNNPLKIALWTGSLGLLAVLFRRLVRRRRAASVEVGSVSEDWLAQHRGSGDPYY